jgi:hypothetical protein
LDSVVDAASFVTSDLDLMKHLITLCYVGLLSAAVMPAQGGDQLTLRLVQTIPLPGVSGRLDHMAVDLEKNRLFVAAVANGTLEVLDLNAGKAINSIPGIKDPATDLIYFGYGGQNAGYDAYERVGVLQAKRGAQSDQFIADMIAPTYRPGHLAEMASILAFEPVL